MNRAACFNRRHGIQLFSRISIHPAPARAEAPTVPTPGATPCNGRERHTPGATRSDAGGCVHKVPVARERRLSRRNKFDSPGDGPGAQRTIFLFARDSPDLRLSLGPPTGGGGRSRDCTRRDAAAEKNEDRRAATARRYRRVGAEGRKNTPVPWWLRTTDDRMVQSGSSGRWRGKRVFVQRWRRRHPRTTRLSRQGPGGTCFLPGARVVPAPHPRRPPYLPLVSSPAQPLPKPQDQRQQKREDQAGNYGKIKTQMLATVENITRQAPVAALAQQP